jgi:hypothetical protein
MTKELHCSACDALIQPRSQFCPKCGLQLMAIAQPAVYVEEARFPLWGIILVALVAFIILANIESHYDQVKASKTAEALTASINAGEFNSPAAFEARCGMPRWTKTTPAGDELHYFTGGQDYYVTFGPTSPVFESEQSASGHAYRVKLEPSSAMRKLGCK